LSTGNVFALNIFYGSKVFIRKRKMKLTGFFYSAIIQIIISSKFYVQTAQLFFTPSQSLFLKGVVKARKVS